jgi:hypothetical protein
MWIPGEWLIFILMEKVLGLPLDIFWKPSKQRPAMTRAQRDEVREGLREALSRVKPPTGCFVFAYKSSRAVFRRRLCPYDHERDNLLWNVASKKW